MFEKRRLGRVLLWAVALYAGGCLAEAHPSKQRMSEIQGDIQRLQGHLGQQEKEHTKLSTQLREVESKISRVVRNLRQSKEKINKEKIRLAQLKVKKKNLDQALVTLKETVETYLVAMYMSQNNVLKQWLGGENHSEIERYSMYRNYLYADQLKQMNQLLVSMREAHALGEDIQQRLNAIEITKKCLDNENQQLKKAHRTRQGLLSIVNKKIKRTQGELQGLKTQEARLKHILDTLSKGSGVDGASTIRKGHLHWPTQGKVVKRFGKNRIGGMRWNGMVINAPLGTTVKAVFSGKIVFSDWLRGYGLLIIIDHGQGVMSLYGYNEAIDRFVGEFVQEGEIIARSGADDLNHPSSYFELRVKGKPVNPVLWLRHETKG